MKFYISATIIFALCVGVCCAQCGSVSGQTYTASSCSESNVQSCYTTEQASALDGDIIAIPAGTCTWSSLWSPSPTHTLTFQGAGAETPSTSCTFNPSSPCTTTSGTDQTVIQDGTSGTCLLEPTIAANKTLRITGIEYLTPSSGYTDCGNGQWQFQCTTGNCQLRLDHDHFYGYSGKWITIYGWGPFGSADHNLVDLFTADTNWISMFNGSSWEGYTNGTGNGSWATASNWGSYQMFSEESNIFPADETGFGVYVNDCSDGGRQVFRFNTFEDPDNGIQGHEGGGDNRGCRTSEAYDNAFTGQTPDALLGVRSGSAIVHSNVGYWSHDLTPSIDRTNTDNGDFNPNNLGLCGYNGTATSSGSTVSWVSTDSRWSGSDFYTNWPDVSTHSMTLNGTAYPIQACSSTTSCTLSGLTGSNSTVPWTAFSTWDGNTNSYGWPCYDQPGRGQGDLITGSFSPGGSGSAQAVTGASWSSASGGQATLTFSSNSVTSGYFTVEGIVPVGYNSNGSAFQVVSHTGTTLVYALASNPGTYSSGGGVTTRLDSVTNTPTWPNEVLDPSYVFNDSNTSGRSSCVGVDSSDTNTEVDNRDFYQQFGTNCESGSFNGTAGVGQGLLSAIPSTCTAGSGGGLGVGYWATDQGNWNLSGNGVGNGALYVCQSLNGTNQWAVHYVPYQYPNPILTAPAAPTMSPATGSYSGTQTVTLSSTTSGATIWYTRDGSVPSGNTGGAGTHGTSLANGGTISVGSTEIINAVATTNSNLDSTVNYAAYEISGGSTYSITVTSPVGGSVTDSQSLINCPSTCSTSSASGTDTLTFTPSAGYSLQSVTGCTLSGNTCAVTTTATITAAFMPIASANPILIGQSWFIGHGVTQ